MNMEKINFSNVTNVECPDGMEYYVDNGIIKFRPIEKLPTYNEIMEFLFGGIKQFYYLSDSGTLKTNPYDKPVIGEKKGNRR